MLVWPSERKCLFRWSLRLKDFAQHSHLNFLLWRCISLMCRFNCFLLLKRFSQKKQAGCPRRHEMEIFYLFVADALFYNSVKFIITCWLLLRRSEKKQSQSKTVKLAKKKCKYYLPLWRQLFPCFTKESLRPKYLLQYLHLNFLQRDWCLDKVALFLYPFPQFLQI